MSDLSGSLIESAIRTAFVAFILWMFAANFDVTEGLVIGLYVVMEGVLLRWKGHR